MQPIDMQYGQTNLLMFILGSLVSGAIVLVLSNNAHENFMEKLMQERLYCVESNVRGIEFRRCFELREVVP